VFQQRTQVAAEAKEAMAAVAAGLVGSGVSVFIDAGTSALAVARRLVPRRELTLFTSSVPLLQMGFGDGARVVAIGGELRVPSQSLVGAPALAWLDGLHFDTAFLGASGLHARDGACVTSLEEAAVKRAVLKRSAMVVLLADAGKWQRPAAVGFAGWSAFDVWVTDMPVPSGTESTQPAVKILVAGEAV
jgi:DeoR/GlpR family transcriptional regulator of sugar metabolism